MPTSHQSPFPCPHASVSTAASGARVSRAMGCTTSHDAFAAAVTSSSSRARARPRARRASAGGDPDPDPDPDPAVLCRERVALIRAAADRRYALAAAHAAYFRSLAAVGDALRRFAASALAPATSGSASPVLTLPPSPAKPVTAASAASLPPSPQSSSSSTVSPLSHSLSDDSDSDDEDLRLHDLDDDDTTTHRGGRGGNEEASTSTSTRYHHHYMRRSSTVPTVVYEDPDAHTQYTTAEASYGYAYAYGDGYSYGPAYPYGPYGEVIAGEMPVAAAPRPPGPPPSPPAAEVSPWDFFDPFSQYDQFVEDYASGDLPTNSPNYAELRRMEGIPELEDEAKLQGKAEKSKPSTSGVSDQKNVKGKGPIQDNAASNGDFSGDSKLQKNATSKGDSSGGKLQRDATSIRDSSGGKLQRKGSEPAPDGNLQRKGSEPATDDAKGEVGKPVFRNDSVPSNDSSKTKEGGKKSTVSLKGTVSSDIAGSSTSGKKKGVAFEAEQSIRAPEGGGGESHGKSIQSVVSSEPFSPLHHGTRDVREAIDEVKELFDLAANCSTDVSRLLEVGKVPPRDTHTPRVLRYISSRVKDPLGLTVSTSSCLPKSHDMKSRASSSKANTSASSGAGPSNGIGRLSSTLEKLWFWEKKLYQEIKDEEKLRVKYEKCFRRLKSMDERGAESSTIDSTEASLKLLKSKISVNIGTAKSFSLKIQEIRDEELYPQLVDLIERSRKLWKAVLECHEKQLLAIQDSRIRRLKAMTVSESDAATEASRDLERELTKWYRCFNKWMSSQRSCAEALNEWLKKWLPEVQEEVTADGAPPYSPGRLGAPPIFVISNDWFQAIEMVSMTDVLRAISYFSKLVHELKKSQENEQRQKRKADHASNDYYRKRKDLEEELGVTTMANPRYRHDNRVMDLEKLKKRRDEESTRHDKILSHAHVAASATLPIGLVPVLQQITRFFQGNQQVYMEIRIEGA